LIQYPHGCIEQTTSAAFPQLFVDVLAPLTQKQKDAIAKNVGAAIQKLRNFQQNSGAFSYWPGDSYVNEWTCSYAGHFLLEAKSKGYAVPEGMVERWTEFQTRTSRAWQAKNSVQNWENYDHDLSQAYRLYTLALAGKADLASMNRLREKKDMYSQSAYMLAGAYAQSGKPEVASELAKGAWKNDWRYDWCGYTYGSDLRDRALLLETYTAMGDGPRAQAMLNYICEQLGGQENWSWSTQGLSTALRALSKYVTKNFNAQGAAYAYRIGGNAFQNGDLSKPVGTVDFTERNASNVAVKNNGTAKLYTRIMVNGQALVGDQSSTASNLNLSIRYLDADGKPLDPARIAQGTDFYAEVTVKRSSTFTFPFTELALSQIFPSGWEIMNDRMSALPVTGNSAMDYQDIRDDRVFTYFDLWGGGDVQRMYKVQLNAAYAGRYYLPTVACEGMYDSRVRASVPGKWVEVI
jgi:alpha-2-macroglobulin